MYKPNLPSIIVYISLLCTFILSSCSDRNLFNQEEYTDKLEETFPVKNIDSNQTWATVGTITANVTVNEETGQNYTIKIYRSNPIDSAAVVLAKGEVANGKTWTTTLDYALHDSVLFVANIDANNRMEVIPSRVTNKTITAVFGKNAAPTKSVVSTRASNDEYAISIKDRPYTDTQINTMLSTADDISTVTDGDFANNGNNANNYYKISGTYSGNIIGDAPKTGTKLIISGIWNIKSNFSLQKNLEIIVANGGQINLPSGVTINCTNQNSTLTVLYGGTINGSGTIISHSGGSIYNGGTLKCGNISFPDGGTLYNADGADLEPQYISLNTSATFINYGSCSVENDILDGNQGCSVLSACKLKVTGTISAKYLTIGSAASVQCKTLNLYGTAKLNANSYLNVMNASYFYVATITGPTDGTNYAICDLAQANAMWSSTLNITNFIYATISKFNYSTSSFHLALTNNAVLVKSGYAKLNISSSSCTDGYTSKDKDAVKVDTDNFSTTYCFEDNYPEPGDYDFNDVVMDMSRSINNNVITLNVKLRAVGASKVIAGAIRLDGITSSEITSITTDNGFYSSLGNALMSEPGGNGYLVSTDSKKSVVIPIFGDVHKALTNSTSRLFYNTSKSGNTVSTKTLKITITTTSSDVANQINYSSIDPYITNGNYEIHTYSWKSNAALTKTASADSQNYIWAIAVPNFSYPIEGTSITIAYPEFESWAKNHTKNLDWYNSPNAEYIY